ncbi:MAG: GH3 auxin-responsive promoter family protein [Deltaproteobacteria bacterium]|nr:GH3 auxin-responsive promoter family protein [Deltaproteobacteria bacterium]
MNFATVCGSLVLKLKGEMHYRSFIDQAKDVQKVQLGVLTKFLQLFKDGLFGEAFQINKVSNVEEFQKFVPICDYESLRLALSDHLNYKPYLYLKTSGTTGEPKYIPLRQTTLKKFKKYQLINTYSQLKAVPEIFSGKLLAIRSPMIEGYFNSVPVGSMSGVYYECLDPYIKAKGVVPLWVLGEPDYSKKVAFSLIFSLISQKVTCLASANPTTFFRLKQIFIETRDVIRDCILKGNFSSFGESYGEFKFKTAPRVKSEILNLLDIDSPKLIDIFPNLKAIVTWKEGPCSLSALKLKDELNPGVKILEAGYLASEGWLTVVIDPLEGICVPAFDNYFFEFLEIDEHLSVSDRPLRLHQLEKGKKYSIIFTSLDGLIRYNINDIVEVCDFFKGIPCLRFVQKGKGITNITGEKVSEIQITETVKQVSRKLGFQISNFFCVANERDQRYEFFLQRLCSDHSELSTMLDLVLQDMNVEYKAKRESQRLKKPLIKWLSANGYSLFCDYFVKNGQRATQLKPPVLLYRKDLPENFLETLVNDN